MSAAIVRMSSVSKSFGSQRVLAGLDWQIAPGQVVGLLGRNGAGKSTLLECMLGLREADGGSVSLFGDAAGALSDATRGRIGYVPQRTDLFDWLTPVQMFDYFRTLYPRWNQAKVDGLLSRWGFGPALLGKPIKRLSGGEQQRLAIIRALAHDPELLILDEPTVGVDPQSRNAIFDYLQQLNRAGVTIIYSTHYMEEAERLCSRIGIIDHGTILALGSVDQLLTSLPFEDEITFPASEATAPLVPQLAAYGELVATNGTQRFRPKSGFPLSQFFALTESLRLSPRLFVSQRPTLEAVFLHLTGRTLRDA